MLQESETNKHEKEKTSKGSEFQNKARRPSTANARSMMGKCRDVPEPANAAMSSTKKKDPRWKN